MFLGPHCPNTVIQPQTPDIGKLWFFVATRISSPICIQRGLNHYQAVIFSRDVSKYRNSDIIIGFLTPKNIPMPIFRSIQSFYRVLLRFKVASAFFILKVTPFIHKYRANINVSRKGNRMKCPMASSIFLKHCSTPVKSGQNPNRLFAPFRSNLTL